MKQTMVVRIHGARFEVASPFKHYGHVVKIQDDDASFWCADCYDGFDAKCLTMPFSVLNPGIQYGFSSK